MKNITKRGFEHTGKKALYKGEIYTVFSIHKTDRATWLTLGHDQPYIRTRQGVLLDDKE